MNPSRRLEIVLVNVRSGGEDDVSLVAKRVGLKGREA